VHNLFKVTDSHFQYSPVFQQHIVFPPEAETTTSCYSASGKSFSPERLTEKTSCHTTGLPTCHVKKGNLEQNFPASGEPRGLLPLD